MVITHGSYGFDFFPLAGDPKKLMDLCQNNQPFSVRYEGGYLK